MPGMRGQLATFQTPDPLAKLNNAYSLNGLLFGLGEGDISYILLFLPLLHLGLLHLGLLLRLEIVAELLPQFQQLARVLQQNFLQGFVFLSQYTCEALQISCEFYLAVLGHFKNLLVLLQILFDFLPQNFINGYFLALILFVLQDFFNGFLNIIVVIFQCLLRCTFTISKFHQLAQFAFIDLDLQLFLFLFTVIIWFSLAILFGLFLSFNSQIIFFLRTVGLDYFHENKIILLFSPNFSQNDLILYGFAFIYYFLILWGQLHFFCYLLLDIENLHKNITTQSDGQTNK